MPKAVKLTEENIPHLTAYAKERRFNLDLQDELDEGIYYDTSIYLITDGSVETNNVVFTTMWEKDFFSYWKFEEATEWIHGFTTIVKI